MWRSLFLTILTTVGWGQLLAPPDSRQARELKRFFDDAAGAKDKAEKLNCRVIPFPARLSFGFQHWTGYDIALPVRQFATGGREKPMTIAVEVKPGDASTAASYFYSRAAFPRKVPAQLWLTKNAEMNLGGGFLVGAGKYSVSLWLMDSLGRGCRKSWKVEAQAKGVPLVLSPGEVAENGVERWKGVVGGSGKLSVYLHAAPMMRRRIMTKLSAWDRNVLLSSLKSLLEVGGFGEARVKVFDFDGRRVLFESESFGAEDYERLSEVLRNLGLGTVSMETLKGPNEEAFLTSMIGEEVGRKDGSDAVVFLGPSWRWGEKLSPLLKELRGQLPATYYLSLTPWFATSTDLIEMFVKAGPKGKVLTVYQPVDLAKAIREIREKKN